MNILEETTALIAALGIPAETGVFTDTAPETYIVVTPLADTYQLFSDDRPGWETQEARLSLYSRGNYLTIKKEVLTSLFAAGFTVTQRLYIGHEDDTGYHHYAIDIAKLYPAEG